MDNDTIGDFLLCTAKQTLQIITSNVHILTFYESNCDCMLPLVPDKVCCISQKAMALLRGAPPQEFSIVDRLIPCSAHECDVPSVSLWA